MNITLWEIVIWVTLGLCSFYVGRITSYNKDIWIAHEAFYHIDDDDYKFDGVKIYFPFLISLIVNVVVNTLIYVSLVDGTSLLFFKRDMQQVYTILDFFKSSFVL